MAMYTEDDELPPSEVALISRFVPKELKTAINKLITKYLKSKGFEEA